MKIWIASASALLLAAACSASKDANDALQAMNLATGTSSALLKYEGKSGSGDKITLKNVTLGPKGSGLKAATLTFGGLDMAEGAKPTFTSVTLKGIAPDAALPDGMKFNLDTITVDGLNPVTGAFLASTFKEGDAVAPPPFEQWGFSKISFNGMTFSADGAAMGAAGKVNVQLGEFSISDLKNTIFGAARMSGLKGDFDVPPEAAGMPIKGTFDFGVADIKGIRGGIFADAVSAGMNAATNPSGVASLEADVYKSFTSPLEPGYDGFNWTGMNIDASGAKLVVSKVEQKITRNGDGVVTALSSPRATLTFSADSAGGAIGQQATMALAMVGYPSSKVELYAGGDATFDPATDTTRYVNYSFGLTDGMDIQATGGLQGLHKALGALMTALTTFSSTAAAPGADPFSGPAEPGADPAPAPDMSGLEALKVVDLDLTITDKSLMTFILGVSAMFGGAGDPEALRADIVNQVMALAGDASQMGVDQGVASEFATAVAAFVKQPGSLNIKLKPAQPLGLADTKAPLTKQALGFSATFKPSPTPPPKPN